ncbi:MAG: cobalt ECF transporter T component CbiQ [Dehalococcoidia bacterium]
MHAADGRIKLVLAVAFIVSVSLLPEGSFVALAIAWAGVLGAGLLSKVGLWRLIRSGFLALPFVVAALPLAVTRGGEALATIHLFVLEFEISREGTVAVATILLKSWISVQAAGLLIFTTRFHDLVHSLERLRLPHLMVLVIHLMYRYIAVLTDEASRMMRARASRAASPPGASRPSTVWQARVVGNLVGALFLRSYARSERVYAAMQSRGYDGSFRAHPATPARAWDLVALGAVMTALALYFVASRWWLPVV